MVLSGVVQCPLSSFSAFRPTNNIRENPNLCRPFFGSSATPLRSPSFSLPPSAAPDPLNREDIAEWDTGDGIEIEVTKIGRNRRRVEARVGVEAELETVWGVLTDYEGLADFIPSLAVSKLLQKGLSFARIYQVGQQELALGFKFNAKGILDCYEKELELLPSGRRRDIEFRMVEGDFQLFEGIWSIVQDEKETSLEERSQSQTTLSYIVQLEPKLWLPVRLLEGRICREIRINLSSIRDEAQRVQN